LLEVKNINTRYDILQVLWDVSLFVNEGEFVALIGQNGAGKSTTLKSIAGLLIPTSGEVIFRGKEISKNPAHIISRKGISYISEGLNLFTNMSVQENLLLGAYAIKERDRIYKNLSYVYSLFPRLEERKNQLGGTLSGGERKMLAIARGLMSEPRLLLVDEPSLGLAPNLVQDVFRALQELQRRGVTILLVEQNVHATLEITDRAYVMEQGRIVLEGASQDLREAEHVKDAYLGL
jgi:branched-chain amino acid transport system ATP-binding protein